jgi:signal transduction histidine kinase
MTRLKLKRYGIISMVFVFVFSLFTIAAFFEYRRSDSENLGFSQLEIQRLTDKASGLIDQSIHHADGVVSFIKSNPNLNQSDFALYAKELPTSEIISHYVAIKDTTIVFAHPLAGNESGIGVDLSTIEGQKYEIEKVKNERISILVGPVDLVQGGQRLINRMPIYIDDLYWGQLSLVIDYEKLIEVSSIYDYAVSNNISIEQVNEIDGSKRLIFGTSIAFSENAIHNTLLVPNGKWEITIEKGNKIDNVTPLLALLIVIGLFLSVISAIMVIYVLDVNVNLNDRVAVRTSEYRRLNEELYTVIERLRTTQNQLVMKEKQAAMGELVAGVAHEINTPLGVSITAVSYMKTLADNLNSMLTDKTLAKSKLYEGLDALNESARIVETNLERASSLVNSFKQLSADMHIEGKKKINLKTYIDYIVHAMSPTLRGTKHRIDASVIDLDFVTFPGSISQVLTNLLMNSITHGFETIEEGRISIECSKMYDQLIIDYYDNGVGIDPKNSEKIFNPFFTTKRNEGNTGLGLNIVFNIVTQQLAGDIKLINDKQDGVHFRIVLPIIDQ